MLPPALHYCIDGNFNLAVWQNFEDNQIKYKAIDKHVILFIDYMILSIENNNNNIFCANHQIFSSQIIPHIVSKQMLDNSSKLHTQVRICIL